jgi:mannose-6-phosphate isomerase-like protein (cupin superfamily)
MVRWTPITLVASVLFGYLAGAASTSRSVAAAQQATATAPPSSSAIPLAPNQGEPTYWSADDLKNVHAQLAARSNGRIVSKPRDLMQLPMMRTHMFDVVHRPKLNTTPAAEQHEGVTDLYIVLGGAGTLTVGGEIADRKMIPNRPGEYTGGAIKGGRSFRLKTGDIVDVPPNTPHASQGDEGGLTYMLIKVNVGLYPWSLVSGAQ